MPIISSNQHQKAFWSEKLQPKSDVGPYTFHNKKKVNHEKLFFLSSYYHVISHVTSKVSHFGNDDDRVERTIRKRQE